MKKFMLLYYGYQEPTQQVMDAWGKWFASIEDRIVDIGSPLGSGREITHTGSRELSPETGAATGYTILSADSIDEAAEIAKGCPLITSVRVYEAMPM